MREGFRAPIPSEKGKAAPPAYDSRAWVIDTRHLDRSIRDTGEDETPKVPETPKKSPLRAEAMPMAFGRMDFDKEMTPHELRGEIMKYVTTEAKRDVAISGMTPERQEYLIKKISSDAELIKLADEIREEMKLGLVQPDQANKRFRQVFVRVRNKITNTFLGLNKK